MATGKSYKAEGSSADGLVIRGGNHRISKCGGRNEVCYNFRADGRSGQANGKAKIKLRMGGGVHVRHPI